MQLDLSLLQYWSCGRAIQADPDEWERMRE